VQRPARDEDPDGASGEGEEQALDDRLPQELPAARADREADAVFALARRPRAARSPARFEQAIRSTRPTIPIRETSGVPRP
jgi:hypothetical protein